MPPDAAASVGGRIRRAREAKGMSQQQLAIAIGRTQTAISYWEAGRRSPDVDDLIALSTALEADISSFFDDRVRQRSARVLLRAHPTLRPLHHQVRSIERFAGHAEELEPLFPTVRVSSDNPTRAAHELLAQARVTAPPIDVAALAELCGVNVAEADFDDEISGVLIDLENGPVIGFNASHPRVRQRFTIAHELGHFLLGHHDNVHIDLTGLASHGDPPGFDWQAERSANEFAAELLMPAALVVQRFENEGRLAPLASTFKVSKEAMSFRLGNLGLVE
jgi:Zn-dependent peptidase ImmA (M78 family)/DNA-binding XRE family transcriptional regulator